MLLPIDPDDPIGLFQAGFKVIAFRHVFHLSQDRAFPSIEIDLLTEAGVPAMALVVISGNVEASDWRFEPELARFYLPTTNAVGELMLTRLFQAAACGVSKTMMWVQYEPDHRIDDFWLSIDVALSASGPVH